MRNFVILLLIIGVGLSVAENTLANTLYGLYSDNSIQKAAPATSAVRNSRAKKKRTPANNTTKTTEYNQTYMPDYSAKYQRRNITNTNELVEKGSKNYSQYGKTMNKTNPVRIDNPYNRFNNSYRLKNQQTAAVSTVNYDGDAVKFKRGKDGNIYGYNKKGKKIGIYRVNSNGTTTQFDTQGNKMGTFK